MRKNEARWESKYKRWQINVQKDGKRKSFYSSVAGKKGKIEAERKADKWLLSGEDENVLAGTMLAQWLDDLAISASGEHFRQYNGYIRRYIAPEIERKRIASITEIDLQRIIDKAYRDRNLAYKTLMNVRGCIAAFFKYCRLQGVTMLRPENIKIPKSASREEKQIAQPEDLKILFGDVQGHFVNAYRFAVLTGLRPGELLALQWSDINGKTVTVRRAVNDRGDVTQGKNRNANRSFRLSDRARKVLEDQHAYLKGIGLISPLVFPDESGGIVRQERYRLSWYRFAKAHDITPITPYEMRHTFISVADDMPDGLKKNVVGHSLSMDTEGVYGHRKQGDMDRAADYIEQAFDRVLNNTQITHSD